MLGGVEGGILCGMREVEGISVLFNRYRDICIYIYIYISMTLDETKSGKCTSITFWVFGT